MASRLRTDASGLPFLDPVDAPCDRSRLSYRLMSTDFWTRSSRYGLVHKAAAPPANPEALVVFVQWVFGNCRRTWGRMPQVTLPREEPASGRLWDALWTGGSQPYRHGLCPAAAPLAVKLIPKV